jgi:pimeloyl-ACP methyl ester carboxylesterase
MLHHKTYELGPEYEWVVFVHGAGGSSAVWFRQLREFRSHFNLLLVDLRGHGGSPAGPAGPEPYTFEEIAAEVVEVLEHLRIPSAHFIGVSLGTIVIRTIGEIAPERVRSMVMGGAVTRLSLRSRFLVRAGSALKRWIPFLWLYQLFAWIIMPRRNHRESRLVFVNEAKKLCQREFLRWFRLTWELSPLLRLFEEREAPVPTLYVMGAEDHLFLPPVRRLVARHRSAMLSVIEGCGHVCTVERPDAFNPLAIQFIRSGGRATAAA